MQSSVMASLDTNILLRWLLNDVPAQSERATRLISSGARLQISDAALIETVYVLESVMRVDREAIRDTIQLIIATGSLALDRRLWNDLAHDFATRPKLSVNDLYLVMRARIEGETPLYTFDKKLASQADGAELL